MGSIMRNSMSLLLTFLRPTRAQRHRKQQKNFLSGGTSMFTVPFCLHTNRNFTEWSSLGPQPHAQQLQHLCNDLPSQSCDNSVRPPIHLTHPCTCSYIPCV